MFSQCVLTTSVAGRKRLPLAHPPHTHICIYTYERALLCFTVCTPSLLYPPHPPRTHTLYTRERESNPYTTTTTTPHLCAHTCSAHTLTQLCSAYHFVIEGRLKRARGVLGGWGRARAISCCADAWPSWWCPLQLDFCWMEGWKREREGGFARRVSSAVRGDELEY